MRKAFIVTTLFLMSLLLAGCSAKPKVQQVSLDPALRELNADWNTYESTFLGIGINVPKNNYHVINSDVKKTIAVPLVVIEDLASSTVSITDAWTIDKDGNKIKDTLLSDVDGASPRAWKISVKNVSDINGLRVYIKERYYPGCDIKEMTPSPESRAYDVILTRTSPDAPENTFCFINWGTVNQYSPSLQKVANWDTGQDASFFDAYQNSYDSEVTQSFRFLNGDLPTAIPSLTGEKPEVSKREKATIDSVPVTASVVDTCFNKGRTCYLRKAFEASDPALCKIMPQDDSTQQGDKAYCLGFMAYIKRNPLICQNQDLDPYFENACRTLLDERFFNQVLFTDLQYMFEHGIDPDIQPKMMTRVMAGELGEAAKAKVNACSGDSFDIDSCYYDIADENRDARICDLMRDREYKGECYFNIAIYKPDSTLCPKIVDEKWRTPCFEKTSGR